MSQSHKVERKDTGAEEKKKKGDTSPSPSSLFPFVLRLQELEDQYRKEREEANNLLEQQRLVQT